MSKQRDLCLEAELTFGSALNARRARRSFDHDVEWHEALGSIGPVDESRRNLAIPIPRSKRGARYTCLCFGLRQRNPRRVVELCEQVELGLPPSEPRLPIRCQSNPSQ